MPLSILIAMSQEAPSQRLGRLLEDLGHRPQLAPDAASAAAALGQGPIDACFLAADLPERLSLARALIDRGKIVVLVGRRPLAGVEQELADGLSSDLLDPEASSGALQDTLRRVFHLRQVLSEREELRAAALGPLDDLLEGPSLATQRLKKEVERVAGTPRTTVLIQGEAGTQKSRLAMGIHGLSVRRRAPLRFIDGRLRRSTPFADHLADLLTASSGGTLVIREVGALELAHQTILAHVLAENPVDTRLIATTSVELDDLASQGLFSDDLFYRLNVLTLRVPSLRERLEDLPGLARRLVSRNAPAGLAGASLSPQAELALGQHDWPGNLQELEASLVRAAHLAQGETIHPGHLGPIHGHESVNGAGSNATGTDGNGAALDLGDRSLRTVEEALIRQVLEDERGNRSRASRILGINRSTLYNKLRLYGID